jgi:hypothetical protein
MILIYVRFTTADIIDAQIKAIKDVVSYDIERLEGMAPPPWAKAKIWSACKIRGITFRVYWPNKYNGGLICDGNARTIPDPITSILRRKDSSNVFKIKLASEESIPYYEYGVFQHFTEIDLPCFKSKIQVGKCVYLNHTLQEEAGLPFVVARNRTYLDEYFQTNQYVLLSEVCSTGIILAPYDDRGKIYLLDAHPQRACIDSYTTDFFLWESFNNDDEQH